MPVGFYLSTRSVPARVIWKVSGRAIKGGIRVMDKTKLEEKLNELLEEVSGMAEPQYKKKLAMLAKQAHDSHKRLEKSVNSLAESLDYLRICIKYQLFDLEATRRENKYLRELLEEKNS
jgi:regulator of replication initiation timing